MLRCDGAGAGNLPPFRAIQTWTPGVSSSRPVAPAPVVSARFRQPPEMLNRIGSRGTEAASTAGAGAGPWPARGGADRWPGATSRYGRVADRRPGRLIQFAKLHCSKNMTVLTGTIFKSRLRAGENAISIGPEGPGRALAGFLQGTRSVDYPPNQRGDSDGGDLIWRATALQHLGSRPCRRSRGNGQARAIPYVNLGQIQDPTWLTPFGPEGLFTERLINCKVSPIRLAPHLGR